MATCWKNFLHRFLIPSKLDKLFIPKKAIAKGNKPPNILSSVISSFLSLDSEQALAFAYALLSIEELFK